MLNAVTEMGTTSFRSCYGNKTDKTWEEYMLPSLLGILPGRTVLIGSQSSATKWISAYGGLDRSKALYVDVFSKQAAL